MLSFALPFSVPLPVPLLRCFAGITYAVRYVLRVAYMAFVARMRSRLPACSLGAGCRMPAACLSALRGGAPLAVVFRSCRAVRFPRRRALGSGVMRCRFHRHRSLCARLFLFLRPAVLAVFLRGVLELLDAASQAAHQFGDFPAAEQEQYDQQDKYQLGRAEEQGEDE